MHNKFQGCLGDQFLKKIKEALFSLGKQCKSVTAVDLEKQMTRRRNKDVNKVTRCQNFRKNETLCFKKEGKNNEVGKNMCV